MCEEQYFIPLDDVIKVAEKIRNLQDMPIDNSNSSDDEIFIDKEHNNNPIPPEPEIR